MPYLERDNIKFYYERQGDGDCVVLMLPGCLGSTDLEFSKQFEYFAGDRFTVISWDAPGFGRSRPPERDYVDCYDRDAELLIYLMVEHLKYSSFNLLGFSDGGRTAMTIAFKHPNRVQKLVLVGVSAFTSPKERRVFELCRDISGWSQERRSKYEKVYGDDLELVWNQWVNMNVKYIDHLTPKLKNIECNTMLLYGEQDIIAPIDPHVRHLRMHIPHVRVHIFPRASHYCHQEKPKEFNKIVEQFLYYL